MFYSNFFILPPLEQPQKRTRLPTRLAKGKKKKEKIRKGNKIGKKNPWYNWALNKINYCVLWSGAKTPISTFRGCPKYTNQKNKHQSPFLFWLPYTGAILLIKLALVIFFLYLIQNTETRPWILFIQLLG